MVNGGSCLRENKLGFGQQKDFNRVWPTISSGDRGEVYSASMLSPQMGNGYFPLWDPDFDAHICNITIVDENFKIDDSVKNIETFSDNSHGYKVHDDVYSGLPVGHIIYYGGPGNI